MIELDRQKVLASFVMVLVLVGFVVLRWQNYFEEQQPELISTQGAARALALALVIEESSGLPRLAYVALWPSPSKIRLFIASELSETIAALESAQGDEARLRDAREVYFAATRANEQTHESSETTERSSPKVQHPDPRWLSSQATESEGEPREAWLPLLLRLREGAVNAIAPARTYLQLISGVRLLAWILTISSMVILLRSRHKVDASRGQSGWLILYWWLQALCLFVVGIDIVEKLMLDAQSQFWFMLAEVAQAVVLIAVSSLAFWRVGFSRLLASTTIGSSLRWSAVGVGLIIGLNEIRAWFAGDLSPMLYRGEPLGITSYRLGLIIVPSIVFFPLVEEMLFRHMFYSATRVWLGPAPWVVMSSLLFTSIHVGSAEHLMFAMLTGISLGIVRERSGSVIPCLIAHSVVNGWWWFQDSLIGLAGSSIL